MTQKEKKENKNNPRHLFAERRSATRPTYPVSIQIEQQYSDSIFDAMATLETIKLNSAGRKKSSNLCRDERKNV